MNKIENGIAESNIFRNLFNVGNATIRTNNYPDFSSSLDFNKTNNQILINGSSSIGTNIFLDSPNANKDKDGIILKAGTYTATIKKVSGSLSGGDIDFHLRKSDGESIYNGTKVLTQKILSGVSDDTVYSDTFTLEEETRLHWIGYFAGELRTFNNLVLQFQIEESTSATEYTPFAGYIVESGSNDNGSWIKYSDGTMICSMSKNVYVNFSSSQKWGVIWESDNIDLGNFPQTFIKKPNVTISNFSGSGGFIEILRDTTTSFVGNTKIARPSDTNNSIEYTFSIIAIGKWK